MKRLFVFLIMLLILLIPGFTSAGFNDRFSDQELEDVTVVLKDITATATELNQYMISGEIEDVSTSANIWVTAPFAGIIASGSAVANAVPSVASAVISIQVGGTMVASGYVASGGAAGSINPITPIAGTTVTAGQSIRIATDGASTTTARTIVTLLITR